MRDTTSFTGLPASLLLSSKRLASRQRLGANILICPSLEYSRIFIKALFLRTLVTEQQPSELGVMNLVKIKAGTDLSFRSALMD